MRFLLALAALKLRESDNPKDAEFGNLVIAGLILSLVVTSQKE